MKSFDINFLISELKRIRWLRLILASIVMNCSVVSLPYLIDEKYVLGQLIINFVTWVTSFCSV